MHKVKEGALLRIALNFPLIFEAQLWSFFAKEEEDEEERKRRQNGVKELPKWGVYVAAKVFKKEDKYLTFLVV